MKQYPWLDVEVKTSIVMTEWERSVIIASVEAMGVNIAHTHAKPLVSALDTGEHTK